MQYVPASRPKIERSEVDKILASHNVELLNTVSLLGIRGYYKNTLGKIGANDIGIYDDALIVRSPDVYRTFNFNTDPQKAGAQLAMLDAGLYTFHKGLHKGKYDCLRPYPENARWNCTRDGVKSLCGAIQIHKGGLTDSYSAGCQTIYPAQYNEAMPLIYSQMNKYGQRIIQYLLIEE